MMKTQQGDLTDPGGPPDTRETATMKNNQRSSDRTMQESFTTFLIKCDADGRIVEVYWHQPVYLLSPFQKHLADVFAEDDMEQVRERIGAVLETRDVLACERTLRLRSPQTAVSVCFMSIKDQVLVMGLDAGFLDQDESAGRMRYIIHEFMKLIRVADQDLTGKREQTIRSQFEQIQMLNNQLINAQRELSKANAELNRLNGYLNDRLVKDELTGLASRYQYRAEIEILINRQPDRLGIFTFIDLDHFKQINDSHGHRTGDIYLQQFAGRLQQIYSSFGNRVCMRIAGDEFGIYLHGFDAVDDDEIRRIWDEIEERILREPALIDGLALPFRCSAGMAVYGLDTRLVYDLIEYADNAMYQAKNKGKNQFQRFDMSQYHKEGE